MTYRRSFLSGAACAAMLQASRKALAQSRKIEGEKVTIILDWLLNTNHAALFAALNGGAFARAGLDVTLIAPSDPDLPPRLVAAGQADMAVSYGTEINLIASAGLPLLRIATLIDTPLNTLMALGSSGIRTLADLKGKKIGVSVSGFEEAILDAMLQSANLRTTDVTIINVNYDLVTALLSRRLDAVMGGFRNAEVLQVQELGEKPVVFLPEQHGIPLYDELILVIRQDRRQNPLFKRFVTALQEGTDTLLKDPQKLWKAFANAHPELDTPLNLACWNATMPVIAKDPARLDAARYLAFQQFALSHGIIGRALPLDDFAVQLVSAEGKQQSKRFFFEKKNQ
jgi:putative hydroxymethylpyrimidine transport system substrate-binding protein